MAERGYGRMKIITNSVKEALNVKATCTTLNKDYYQRFKAEAKFNKKWFVNWLRTPTSTGGYSIKRYVWR